MTKDEIPIWEQNLSEAYDFGVKGIRPGSGCLDWFMADCFDTIAIFTGGGLDLVPSIVFDDKSLFIQVYIHFLCRGSLDGVYDSYKEWDEQDFIVFDTTFSGNCRGVYKRQYVPDKALNISDVDKSINCWFENIKIEGISFQEVEEVDFTKFFKCI